MRQVHTLYCSYLMNTLRKASLSISSHTRLGGTDVAYEEMSTNERADDDLNRRTETHGVSEFRLLEIVRGFKTDRAILIHRV